ncbi:MAG: geranylgeranylglycerol-phosphate geranylgeranyltransferase [Fibrobacter sp.]|uniref:geranylgeranylglycerol-phosphate geranylgeranyltransferase n=1 Tax=Fibrobacter sp. TaxID=35828 RepID=UPI0025C3390A|nr:geranylgeranylglycerol-phosphate geranylgeranyltransferase [Fibrobacter sp.]MBR4784431.1 geranylgeranylglycerol-phosphate geranylgeranyltransferase [Fibrobacter sp.]
MFEALFKMTRPVNIVIAIITLVVGYVLLNFPSSYFIPDDCNSDLDWINWRLVFIQALAFAFAIGFANIQNDILDLESDKMNRPERPLVTGKVSVKAARITWITLFVLMLLFGLESFPLVLFFPVLGLLLMAYNKWLKHIPLLKNMTVAFLCTTPLLLAMMHFLFNTRNPNPENYIWAIIPAIPFAFLLTTAREIYKDLEDETGDLKAGIMTFPLIAGSATAHRLAGAIIVFTWISLPLPVFYMDKVFGNNYPPLFLILTGITLTPCFAYVLVQAHRQKYRKAQTAVKVGMFLGLIALLISA